MLSKFITNFTSMSFAIYKSSAGSGKTFTLVREYLHLVLKKPENFRHILAITFTHKAANEMRERIIETLNKLSTEDDDLDKGTKSMFNYLVESTGMDKAEIASRCKTVLGLILHNYSDFAISTIDSFVHRIIRSFAFDLRLPLNFDVELDENNYVSEAVDLLIDRIGIDELVTKILIRFMETRIEEEENWKIENLIKKFAFQLLKEDVYPFLDELKSIDSELLLQTDQYLKKNITAFEQSLSAIGKNALDIVESNGLDQKSFYQGSRGIIKYFMYLKDGKMDKLNPNTYVLKTLDKSDWSSGNSDSYQKDKIKELVPSLRNLFEESQELRRRDEERFHLFQLLRENLYPVAMLNEISLIFDEIRHEKNVIHISEFNKRIADVVAQQPVPFIYERVGEKYQHYLIDEFQDTSLLQWSNLIPLIENSLAERNFNMIVGDAKQSIYRWRSGDVDQFIALPQIIKRFDDSVPENRYTVFSDLGRILNLDTNYRSMSEIVKFNNDFFSVIKDHFPERVKKVYKDVEQKSISGKEGGFVDITRFDKDLVQEDYNIETVTRIKQVIDELIEDGYGYSDVAIICRTKSSGSQIALYLLNEGVKVISDESLMLKSSPKVGFINSFLKCVEDSEDQINVAVILEYFKEEGMLDGKKLHDFVNAADTGHKHLTLFEILKLTGISINFRYLESLPVYDMVEYIIRVFGLDKTYDPFIQFYLDNVLQLGSRNLPGLKDWLDWWDENGSSLSVKMPEGIDAIRILTIHKSKGLQFPVVIFPFADLEIGVKTFSKKNAWVLLSDREFDNMKVGLLPINNKLLETRYKDLHVEEYEKTFLDTINLAYVAMTRPIERLYVLQKLPPDSNNTVSLKNLLEYYLIEKGYPEKTKSLSFGVRSARKIKSGESVSVHLISSISNGGWRNRILISKITPDQWDVFGGEDHIEWGNLLHGIMSSIRNKSDLNQLKDQVFNPKLDKARKHLLKLFSNNEMDLLFESGWSVLTEQEIKDKSGRFYRPDRIMIKDNKARIIDFKTGAPSKFHQDQMDTYAGILRSMGLEIETSLLIYLTEPLRIVRL